jgi:hypothetical protein
MPAPMPFDAPVTIATFPASLFAIFVSSRIGVLYCQVQM